MSPQPLHTGNSLSSNFSQLNNMMRQLEKEQTTKVYKQANGPAIIQGKLPFTTTSGPAYGELKYDEDGRKAMLDGRHPDGSMNITIMKPGYDVIDDISW
jgi:hypothetical protein